MDWWRKTNLNYRSCHFQLAPPDMFSIRPSMYIIHYGKDGGESKKKERKKKTDKSTVSVLHVFIVIALDLFV